MSGKSRSNHGGRGRCAGAATAGLGSRATTWWTVASVKDIVSLLGAVQAAQQESGGDPQALAAALRESLGANAVITSAGAFAEPDDKLDRLEKLGHLRDQGILTEDEFQTEKQKILAGP